MSLPFLELPGIVHVLSCPVCLELPSDVISQCEIGHNYCQNCKNKLTLCPLCKAPFTNRRNLLLENLIPKLSEYEIIGNDLPPPRPPKKKQLLPDNNIPLRSLQLPAGNYLCFLETCINGNEWSVGNLLNHVRSAHKHLYNSVRNEMATFHHDFDNFCLKEKKACNFHQVLKVSNMGLFYLMLRTTDDCHILCRLSMAAPPDTSDKLNYQLTFTNNKNNENVDFVNKVASNHQNEAWLLERSRVFIITPQQHGLQKGDFFSLKLKIVYKPENAQ